MVGAAIFGAAVVGSSVVFATGEPSSCAGKHTCVEPELAFDIRAIRRAVRQLRS